MTLKDYYRRYGNVIAEAIADSLKEDRIKNDITTKLLLSPKEGNQRSSAVLWCKEDCVLAGLDIFRRVYRQIDSSVRFKSRHIEGAKLRKGTKVIEVSASLKTLLTGERTALNFLQRMSGIATLTNAFLKKLKHKDAKILHTRKTTPNFRVFEAAAVKTGGGDFHRLSLDSYVLIKDNHIEALGGIEPLLNFLKLKNLSSKQKQKFEIEVKSFKELDAVIKHGRGVIKTVMLDNFKPGDIEHAAGMLKKAGFKTELSGGINLSNFSKYQKKGIDYYSIGALTHSYRSVDFSLDF
jgi:nicotinate-nucleotide pyrophosphorylase (carboxylating)